MPIDRDRLKIVLSCSPMFSVSVTINTKMSHQKRFYPGKTISSVKPLEILNIERRSRMIFKTSALSKLKKTFKYFRNRQRCKLT